MERGYNVCVCGHLIDISKKRKKEKFEGGGSQGHSKVKVKFNLPGTVPS
jgi:hypothetical protein